MPSALINSYPDPAPSARPLDPKNGNDALNRGTTFPATLCLDKNDSLLSWLYHWTRTEFLDQPVAAVAAKEGNAVKMPLP